MLDESFREAMDGSYIPKIEDLITVSKEEMEDFRERAKNISRRNKQLFLSFFNFF